MDWEPVYASVDYWTRDLEDGIGLASLQGLIESELLGQCVNTGRTENTIDTGVLAEIIECSPGNVLKRDPATERCTKRKPVGGKHSSSRKSLA